MMGNLTRGVLASRNLLCCLLQPDFLFVLTGGLAVELVAELAEALLWCHDLAKLILGGERHLDGARQPVLMSTSSVHITQALQCVLALVVVAPCPCDVVAAHVAFVLQQGQRTSQALANCPLPCWCFVGRWLTLLSELSLSLLLLLLLLFRGRLHRGSALRILGAHPPARALGALCRRTAAPASGCCSLPVCRTQAHVVIAIIVLASSVCLWRRGRWGRRAFTSHHRGTPGGSIGRSLCFGISFHLNVPHKLDGVIH
mmetsp:Transcript_4690/g.12855  ORF Transcript_4690/g.12855 Transcript_4690/m.12855 type:complete len:257 (-) Transcript_4690:1605-2375(-)